MKKSIHVPFHGEPNRLCDIIAEMLVEEFTKKDSSTRCRLSVFGAEGMIMVAGHVQSQAEVDIGHLVKEYYKQLTGKEDIEPFVHIQQENSKGFEATTWKNQESGIAYGFATSETEEQIPFGLREAHRLRRAIEDARLSDPACHFLGHGGSVNIATEGKEVKRATITVEHIATVVDADVKQVVTEHITKSVLPESALIEVQGMAHDESGFAMRNGASGVAVDAITYGGMIPRASHAFTGMDIYAPARLAIYEARRLAKYILHTKGGKGNVLVQLPYAESKILTSRAYAIDEQGKEYTKEIQRDHVDTSAFVEKFDLRKAPLRLMAEHYIFISELAPWEILHEEL